MMDLISRKFDQPNAEKKPVSTKVLKEEIKKQLKDQKEQEISSEEVVDYFERRIEKEKNKIKVRREQLKKKQHEMKEVRKLTKSTLGLRDNHEGRKSKEREDSLMYSRSAMEVSSQKQADKEEVKKSRNSGEEKKANKFALQNRQPGAQLETIKEKSNFNLDDEVDGNCVLTVEAVKRELEVPPR